MTHKNIQILVPMILYVKTNFVAVTKLRVLRWGDYSGLPRWVLNAISRRYDKDEEGNVTNEARCFIAGFENGEAISPGMQGCNAGKEQVLSQSPWKECSLADTLILPLQN